MYVYKWEGKQLDRNFFQNSIFLFSFFRESVLQAEASYELAALNLYFLLFLKSGSDFGKACSLSALNFVGRSGTVSNRRPKKLYNMKAF